MSDKPQALRDDAKFYREKMGYLTVADVLESDANDIEQLEREHDEIERRLAAAEQQLKLSRQRIAVLTAVAVLAYKFRRAPIMCDEHNRLDRQLAAALEAAGIKKDTPAVQIEQTGE